MLKGVGHKAHLIQLVKLVGGDYTQEHGALGAISRMYFQTDDVTPSAVWVSWCGPPHGEGGSSGPIDPNDLEVLGTIYIDCKE